MIGEDSSHAQRPRIRRGARACNACRKGKNRCDDAEDPPCKRCRTQGIECVFEQPTKQCNSEEERLAAVETSVTDLHAKMDLVLKALMDQNRRVTQHPATFGFEAVVSQPQLAPLPPTSLTQPTALWDNLQDSSAPNMSLPGSVIATTAADMSNLPFSAPAPGSWGPALSDPKLVPPVQSEDPGFSNLSPASSSGTMYNNEPGASRKRQRLASGPSSIVNYPAPRPRSHGSKRTNSVHPSNTLPPEPSPRGSDHLSSQDMSKGNEASPEGSNLTAPFEALADAAARAAEGAPDPLSRARTPPNGDVNARMPPPATIAKFSKIMDVVTKGLISDHIARGLWKFYHDQLSGFIAILDPNDTYDSMKTSAPATFNVVIAVTCRRHPDNASIPRSVRAACKQEAEENARSTFFGAAPTRDNVQAVTLLSAWSFDHTYISTGHALRLALQLRMHQALGQLQKAASEPGDQLPDRELVVAARTWLLLAWLDWQVSLGSGRPLNPHQEDGPLTEAKYNALLEHPASLPGDIKLASNNILMYHMHAISEATFDPPSETVNFVKETNARLQNWCDSWRRAMEEGNAIFHRSSITRQLHAAKTFLAARALENSALLDQEDLKELADLSFEACLANLNACLSPSDPADYTLWLRWASTPNFVEIAWGGIWVLQVLKLCPLLEQERIDKVLEKVQELAALMETWPAQRYSLTMKIALERFYRTRQSPSMNHPELNMTNTINLDYDLNDLLSSAPDQWSTGQAHAWFSENFFGAENPLGPLQSFDQVSTWHVGAGQEGGFPVAW